MEWLRGEIKKDRRNVRYYLNYSGQEQEIWNQYGDSTELLTGEPVKGGESIRLPGWGVKIMEGPAAVGTD